MVLLPQCVSCKHLIGSSKEGKVICKAFPNGIPNEYLASSGNYEEDEKATKIDNQLRIVHRKIDPRQEGYYVFY